MPSRSIRSLARDLDVPERTLRRAAAQGLVRGARVSARRYEASMREEAYLRRHWPLLSSLREALRTEPNVRLAVLFGSQASGRAAGGSDIDLLVHLDDGSASRLAGLAGRLERPLGRDVQLVRLDDAHESPSLLRDAIAEGRVLVDRDDRWPDLKASETAWRRRAAKERSLEQAAAEVDLS